MPTLQEIADHFKRCTFKRRIDEGQYYTRAGDIIEAINRSVGLIDYRGLDHSHQNRIKPRTLEKAREALLDAIGRIRLAKTFDELHSIVEDVLMPIDGVGVVLVYDAAQRIGLFLDIKPVVVYLHAGTAAGAKHLGFSGKTVSRAKLPPELRKFSASDLEDLFCNYKGALAGDHLPPCYDELQHKLRSC